MNNTPRTSASFDILQTKLLFFRNYTDNAPISTQYSIFADGSGGTYWSSFRLENLIGWSSFYASTVGAIQNLGSAGYISTGATDGYAGIGSNNHPASATLDVDGSVYFRSSLRMKGPVAINKTLNDDILANLDVSGSIVTSYLYCTNSGTFNGNVTASAYLTSSDSNLKKDITTYVPNGNAWDDLRGVRFTWKKDDRKDVGFIAQELEKVIPEAVVRNEDGEVHIEPTKLLPLLVETVKDLRARVSTLEAKL